MATFDYTFPVGAEAGAVIRMLAQRLQEIAMDLPDRHSSGAPLVLRFDNAPATGSATVQIVSGPEVYIKTGKKGV